MSTSKLLTAIRKKDYVTAKKFFEAVMQRKVNACLSEARKSVLKEGDYAHPDKDGKFTDEISECPKCHTKYPYVALTDLAHMGSDECPDCGVKVKRSGKQGTFRWNDEENIATLVKESTEVCRVCHKPFSEHDGFHSCCKLALDRGAKKCPVCDRPLEQKFTEANDLGLPIVHAGSPLKTNASINREMAVKMFQAGMTPQDIAKAFPEVFKVTDGKLGQKYDYELGDGSGRLETKRMILSSSVKDAIAKFKASKK